MNSGVALAAALVVLVACSAGGDEGTTATSAGSGGASTTVASSSSSATTSGGDGGGGAPPIDPPSKPPGLTAWLVGDDADADVTPLGPSLVLMGGGADVDEAFVWWAPRVAGGDVVVLRASDEDGYNDYLLGFGADSVETLLVDTRALSDSAYVAYRVAHAEGVFIAGGDQADYIEKWTDTRLAEALVETWNRGAVLGGTSAGCDVLSEIVFAALNGTVYSDEALADPYNFYMTMARDFVALAPLEGWAVDTHFAERDRMGRLVAFMARAEADGWSTRPLGLGIDESTAVVVDADGLGTVVGDGRAYLVVPGGPPETCEPGTPLAWTDLAVHPLAAGDTVRLPDGATGVPSTPLSAGAGELDPASPYSP